MKGIDHNIWNEPVQFASDICNKMTINKFVVDRCVTFFLLALAILLHVEEADVQRVCDLDLCSGS